MSEVIPFPESVRRRPAMYLGAIDYRGISNLISSVIIESLDSNKGKQMIISIAIDAPLSFSLHFEAGNISNFAAECFGSTEYTEGTMFHKILYTLSTVLQVDTDTNNVKLSSTLDASIFKQAFINYDYLIEELSQIALLNPGTEVVVKDTRARFPRQEYYHYPHGLRHVFDRLCTEQRSHFQFYVDKKTQTYSYRIGVAFTDLWNDHATLISYAGNIRTIEHGSLVDGILKGIIQSAKDFIGSEAAGEYDFSRRRLVANKHLIIIAHVEGDESLFNWEGSVKQKINEPVIKKEAANITHAECLANLRTNPEKATEEIKWMFWKLWDQ